MLSQKQQLHRLWLALEQIPGLAAVTAEWKAWLGPEYDLVKSLFRPNGRSASSYPCPFPKNCGCSHEVITHAPDDIVAVCRCEPSRCETFRLSKSDIVIYEIDRPALYAAIASALEITPENTPAYGLPMTCCIGAYIPYTGFRFPVYLTIQIEPDDLRQVIEGLAARNDQPFILLAPTQNLYNSKCEELLKKKKACFMPLADILVWGKNGTLTGEKPAEEILANFRAAVLPAQKDISPIAFFPTPANTTWKDVSIRFTDGHTISIKVKTESGVYNYTQMGMADNRNGDPTKQWSLLESIASGHGVINWDHPDASRKNQKRRELLANNLKAFFRIGDDPFRLTSDGGWQAKFSISSEE